MSVLACQLHSLKSTQVQIMHTFAQSNIQGQYKGFVFLVPIEAALMMELSFQEELQNALQIQT